MERYQLFDTLDTPRPDESVTPHAGELLRQQAAWDQARAADETHLAYLVGNVAERATKEAERRREAAQAHAEQRRVTEERILGPAWESFRAAGGTREEFDAKREQILDAARLRLATEAAVENVTNDVAATQRRFAAQYSG